ncbi:MAG: 5-bromo-4-chloroindolyl phosphate hydrolysis family protein [Treponema sp.]|nr:5-bromo-4-chloroindolyl phosphate hydrolysis family protein [Treponema sp.]
MKKDNWVQVIITLLVSIAVFVITLIVLHWTLGVAVLLSLGCYVSLSFLFIPVSRIGGVNIEHLKNSAEIMTLLEEGEKDLASIKKIAGASKDNRVKAQALDLYQEGEKITGYIKKNPAKAVMARRFFHYYLDKANDILTKYHNLISAGIETERLESLTEKTLSAMKSIVRGMTLQFSRLISSEVIDIEADVKLLESTLKMEDS